MSRRNNPSATKSVYDRDQPHATEHQPAQYRRSRSGRPGFDLRRNQKRELSARDREFAPAWRCGSCCRRRWPPSSGSRFGIEGTNRRRKREGERLGWLGIKSRAREREIPGTNSSLACSLQKKFGTRSSWRPLWFWFGVSCWLLVSSAS